MKGKPSGRDRKKRLTVCGLGNVISAIFESLNCVICMETRPARGSGLEEYQRADFLRNFAQIKRATMGKKDRGQAALSCLPVSRLLSASFPWPICIIYAAGLGNASFINFEGESPLMSNARSIHGIFHRRSSLFPPRFSIHRPFNCDKDPTNITPSNTSRARFRIIPRSRRI